MFWHSCVSGLFQIKDDVRVSYVSIYMGSADRVDCTTVVQQTVVCSKFKIKQRVLEVVQSIYSYSSSINSLGNIKRFQLLFLFISENLPMMFWCYCSNICISNLPYFCPALFAKKQYTIFNNPFRQIVRIIFIKAITTGFKIVIVVLCSVLMWISFFS
jgi:hypothetical protein